MPTETAIIPLIGDGTRSRSYALSNDRILNMYVSLAQGANIPYKIASQGDPKYLLAAYSTPGSEFLAQTPNKGEIRALLPLNDVLYIISGNKLYGMGKSLNFIELGTINTFSGRACIISSDTDLMVVDGNDGWNLVIQTGVFTRITDPNFPIPAPTTAFYQGFRSILIAPETQIIWTSALNDFTTYSQASIPLYAAASSDAQNALAAFIIQFNLLIFKEYNTEIWQLTPNNGFPYAPLQNVTMDHGLAALFSIVGANNTVYWLSKNQQGKALLLAMSDYQPKAVLDEDAQNALSELEVIDDAEAFCFQMNGHLFYAITFPTENKSYLVDLRSGKMTEWGSWFIEGYSQDGKPNYIMGRHLSQCYTFWNDMHVIGDYRGNGILLQMRNDLYTDYNCGPDNSIYREIRSSIIAKNKKRMYIDSLWVDCETGQSPEQKGDESNPNQPLMTISISSNAGLTYDIVEDVDMGAKGQFWEPVKLTKLGSYRQGLIKLSSCHPQFSAIFALIANLSVAIGDG